MMTQEVTKTTKAEISLAITKQELTTRVEKLVNEDHISYIEGVLQVCNELDLDPEDVAKIIVGPLRDKIEAEAQRKNILTKPNSLFADDLDDGE